MKLIGQPAVKLWGFLQTAQLAGKAPDTYSTVNNSSQNQSRKQQYVRNGH